MDLWLNSETSWDFEDGRGYVPISGKLLEEAKCKIRQGSNWNFLRHTSTPCSCKGMCAYYKYERTPKQEVNKDIWQQILDSE